ncbi:MAG TPA: class I SAM-dependent methyltransferase [Candidatus Limnocylindria bacterium]|nr:class I SAM-dependent methyltransferase [Candidatus Limnocylindria bacterium]
MTSAIDPSVTYWRGFYADEHNGQERMRTFGRALASIGAHGHWLDAGCGIGMLARAFRAAGLRVTAVDISDARLAEATRVTGLPLVASPDGAAGEHLLCASVDDLPYADARFDGAYSSSVLEYVPDLGRALSELHRVVRPGGHVVFNLPNASSVFRRVYRVVRANSAYSRSVPRWAYTHAQIARALADAGWDPLWGTYYGAERDVPGIPVGFPWRERLCTMRWAAPFVLVAARRMT